MQTADKHSVATHADWYPGDDVIAPTAGSCGVERPYGKYPGGVTCYDWFFCTKKLAAEEV